jgi:molybdopterin converting factor small subunit
MEQAEKLSDEDKADVMHESDEDKTGITESDEVAIFE